MASGKSITANIPVQDNIGRRKCVPVLYVSGTHYEVGFDMGRTFSSLIQSYLQESDFLKEALPFYETVEGRGVYDRTVAAVQDRYPQYVREVQGIADGAGVHFHELMLLHLDDIMLSPDGPDHNSIPTGCTSICMNEPGAEILGHTEDATRETLNHFYLVAAHIIENEVEGPFKAKEENFVSLCYAGLLPGYTMGYNHHGLVYSINTISAAHTRPGKMPRTFITRSLLAADNFNKVQAVLTDAECGAGNACSVNLTFLNQEGDRLFHNIEMGPKPEAPNSKGSLINTFTISPGEFFTHCNIFSRLKVPEAGGNIMESSNDRLEALKKHSHPRNRKDIENMLSDRTGKQYKVFSDPEDAYIKTIAAGIFDCNARTWSIYIDDPATHNPIAVLPINIKTK